MDRSQLLLVGLPLFLFCSDILSLFSPPPSRPPPSQSPPQQYHHHNQQPQSPPLIVQQIGFPPQKNSDIGAIGLGNSVNIDFCTSCSYRGTAVTMKTMLENQFPGIHVILANYPPPFPKRILSKVVPLVQFGIIGIVMAGEHIFPKLGYSVPPPWYYSLRQNRFGTIASAWLMGNFFQSFLQSSGAFEVYCNGELVFSKLKEFRFPGEIELKTLVSKRIDDSRVHSLNKPPGLASTTQVG